jgi:hypothetical protein
MSNAPLFIRLYLDEDFHPDIAAAIRRHGHDCHSAVEAGTLGATDEDQLLFASAQGRCIVTFNIADFAALAVEWGERSPGSRRHRRDAAGEPPAFRRPAATTPEPIEYDDRGRNREYI